MSKQRYVDTRFWDDPYIACLDPSEKLLFLYLITNPLTNISGIYEITLRRIQFDTGFNEDMVKKILDRFARDGKVVYRGGWIAVKNFIKHQNVNNPKIRAGIKATMAGAPSDLVSWITGGISLDNLSHPNSNSNTNSSVAENGELFPELSNQYSKQPREESEEKKETRNKSPTPFKLLQSTFFQFSRQEKGVDPPWSGKEGNLLKTDMARLESISRIDPDEDWIKLFNSLIVMFFKDRVPKVAKFAQEAGYTYGVFHSQIDSMLVWLDRRN